MDLSKLLTMFILWTLHHKCILSTLYLILPKSLFLLYPSGNMAQTWKYSLISMQISSLVTYTDFLLINKSSGEVSMILKEGKNHFFTHKTFWQFLTQSSCSNINLSSLVCTAVSVCFCDSFVSLPTAVLPT